MADDRAYRILITFDAKNERFESRVPELGVSAKGETRTEAIENIEAEIEAKVAAIASAGDELPSAADAVEAEAGELTLKIAAPVMADLRYAASRSKMEVDDFASQLFFRAVGAMLGTSPAASRSKQNERSRNDDDRPRDDNRGRGNNRGKGNQNRRREGYRPDMDDQANFLAYVRNMEKK